MTSTSNLQKLKISKYILATFFMAFVSCGSKKPIQQTKQPYQPKPITESYNLTTNGINLKVEIDYKLSEFGYLNNDCECNYIITNLSDKTLKSHAIIDTVFSNGTKGLTGKRTKIAFDIKTSDGKTIQIKEGIYEDIEGGYSTQAKKVSGGVGKNRFCTSIKPSKIVYEQ